MKRVELLRGMWGRQGVPVGLFLLMCLNLAVAPAVWAAAGGDIERRAAWAIGLLGILTMGLSVYLFLVIFQPERF